MKMMSSLLAVVATAAAAVVLAAPAANAASLVVCESESGYFDCYLPSGYYSQRWYYDGVLLSGANNLSSAGGTCVPGTRHGMRVTFSGGSSSTNFTCR
ncbi:hypothetical protein QEZ54_09545 [Catellatospora sp. KI3]|uniref:hypothetical protein n=1 Tax=Catellatospora sp. KI3 TaxID=3041620 RepID=UPI002482A3BB|nr:hypothetical protein [Catellatospora sp. KI3]MDI1461209.1 hypothetical protein [Catellatospora sp. KI3]